MSGCSESIVTSTGLGGVRLAGVGPKPRMVNMATDATATRERGAFFMPVTPTVWMVSARDECRERPDLENASTRLTSALTTELTHLDEKTTANE